MTSCFIFRRSVSWYCLINGSSSLEGGALYIWEDGSSGSSVTSPHLTWLTTSELKEKMASICVKFITLSLTIGLALAASLEKVYLPPGSAASAGGSGLIQAPGFTGGSHGAINSGSYQGHGVHHGQPIEILRYNNQNNGDGSYQFNYETANGISAEEAGALQGDSEAVRGSYSYTGPDGVQYTVHYTADENGFHPEGAHLPTPPPIPEEIRRGVELSLAAEARGENQDGQYHPTVPQNYNKYQGPTAAAGGYRY